MKVFAANLNKIKTNRNTKHWEIYKDMRVTIEHMRHVSSAETVHAISDAGENSAELKRVIRVKDGHDGKAWNNVWKKDIKGVSFTYYLEEEFVSTGENTCRNSVLKI